MTVFLIAKRNSEKNLGSVERTLSFLSLIVFFLHLKHDLLHFQVMAKNFKRCDIVITNDGGWDKWG